MREPHGAHLAEAAVADPFARLAAPRDRAVLSTHLHDPIVATGGLDHFAALVNGAAKRLSRSIHPCLPDRPSRSTRRASDRAWR